MMKSGVSRVGKCLLYHKEGVDKDGGDGGRPAHKHHRRLFGKGMFRVIKQTFKI